MLQRLRNLSGGGSSRSAGGNSQEEASSPQQQQRRGVSFRRRNNVATAGNEERPSSESRRRAARSQPSNQPEVRRQSRQRSNISSQRAAPRWAEARGAKEEGPSAPPPENVEHAEAKVNPNEKDERKSETENGVKPESIREKIFTSGADDGGSSDHFRMPELDQWLSENDAREYAGKCIDVCARIQRHEMENYGAKELGALCSELEFDAVAQVQYAKSFEDNALDGWVFLEIIDWQDYAEIGIAKPHAVALCAVAKGIRGDFGYAIPRPSPSAIARDDRMRTRAGLRLSPEQEFALETADAKASEPGGIGSVYGQLVVLGYKEYRVEGSTWHPVGPRNEKFELRRRKRANGIRRSRAYVLQDPSGSKTSSSKRSPEASHSVTMSVAASREPDGRLTQSSKRVTVEYVPDAREDMFQLGRMIVPQNDFVVRGPLHLDSGGVLCGPVSRYACRITSSRLPPFDCKLFAAGFNNERDIFLSEMAPKWQLQPGEIAADDLDSIQHQKELAEEKKNLLDQSTSNNNNNNNSNGLSTGQTQATKNEKDSIGCQWDALTTFGVRIWKPEIGAWREVSVHGGVHEPRQRADVAGARYPDEDSTLTDGTIIDLAGIQLLFESADSMRRHDTAHKPKDPGDETKSPDEATGNNDDEIIVKSPKSTRHLSEPDRIVARFNARRPQCPVQLHTIRLEYDDEKRKALAKDRTPYIFPACGHVHAYAAELKGAPCPLCRTRGPFVELKLEWEPAICDEEPEVAFNPCGHIVSERVARKWANLALPDNAPPNARYRPICPFCAKPLKTDSRHSDQPFNKILFQSQAPGTNDLDDDDSQTDFNDEDTSFTSKGIADLSIADSKDAA